MDQVISFFFNHIEFTYALVMFFFGAAVGSFLNVVICRLPHGMSVISPASSCPKCGRSISGLDNLPILSWVILRGKCRKCRAPVSLRYPAIELFNAVLWSVIAYYDALNDYGKVSNIGVLIVHLVFVSSLVAITFIDFDYQIIPDELSLGGLGFAVIASGLLPMLHLLPDNERMFPATPWLESVLLSCIGAAAGGGLVLVLSLIGTILFRKQIKKAQEEDPEIQTAIGFGDVKLMAFTGALLGWRAVLLAFLVGTCVGAFVGVFIKLYSGMWPDKGSDEDKAGGVSRLLYKWRSGESVIPFGPFLAIGSLVLFFFRTQIIDLFAVYVLHMDLPA